MFDYKGHRTWVGRKEDHYGIRIQYSEAGFVPDVPLRFVKKDLIYNIDRPHHHKIAQALNSLALREDVDHFAYDEAYHRGRVVAKDMLIYKHDKTLSRQEINKVVDSINTLPELTDERKMYLDIMANLSQKIEKTRRAGY